VTHLPLILQLTRRDIAQRYRGTALGWLWTLLTPLFMLAIYTFIFSVVFQARWPQAESLPRGQFALLLFAGLLIHGLTAECLGKAPHLILANTNYVKKVVFPLPALGLVTLLAALFHFSLSVLVLLAFQLFLLGHIPLTALWLPVIVAPFALGLLGVIWLLAALGVYLRDIGQVIGLALMALLFLSPIFYPAEALPEAFRPFLYANPLTLIIEQSRAVLLWGQMPDFSALLFYTIGAALVCLLGHRFFAFTRPGFADVV
jgi:lipopolysaccharide transport system permease protein